MFAIRLRGKNTSTQNKKGAEEIMSQDNGLKDKVKGGMNKMKGEAKDKAGDMADKSDLKAEGKKTKRKAACKRVSAKRKINSVMINLIVKHSKSPKYFGLFVMRNDKNSSSFG